LRVGLYIDAQKREELVFCQEPALTAISDINATVAFIHSLPAIQKMKRYLIALALILTTLSLSAQNLQQEIQTVYNFSPQKLTDKEMQEKSIILDDFWKKVKSDTTMYLPLLRNELESNAHVPFFYFDGSSLLLSIDANNYHKHLAAKAISKCDINDINRRSYVGILNKLSNDGFDVTNAAVKILSDSSYSFFIPQHVFTFNQGYCLSYCLLPLEPSLYIDTLIQIFNTIENISAKKSIITTLWFAHTCKGDELLKKVSEDSELNFEVRDYAKRILSYKSIPKDYAKIAKRFSDKEIDEIRKRALRRFSDEAISELDVTTKIYRNKRTCR
jgi:hypothetical protein